MNMMHKVTLSPDSGCNTPDQVILDQVYLNIRRGLPQAQPYQPNNMTALLVCGGPSLESTQQELVQAYWEGGKIIAVNGAYQWCIENNLKPSAAIVLDAREFNSRFIEREVPGCKYLLASQCHPTTFELCRSRETIIWHACTGGDDEVALLKEYYFDRTHPVTLGTTVGVRAISLMRMLGWQHFDIFGLDSCWLDGRHHAYGQAENDRDLRIKVRLIAKGGEHLAEEFHCAPWHMKQAEDFQQLIKARGNMFHLNVRGPGLIAAILRTGATLAKEN